ncbi:MAG: hypothetical protein ACKVGZ_02095, partial [Alphaproteobacteria bacterium]
HKPDYQTEMTLGIPDLCRGLTLAFLDDVFEKYGQLSAFQLSSLTHRAGTPWEQVYREGLLNTEIPDSKIKEHYMEKLNERDKCSAA